MIRLSGTEISTQIKQELKDEVNKLKKQGVSITLAVILVGDDPASAVYVNNKKLACEKLGIRSVEKKMTQQTTQNELLQTVHELNHDPAVNGILCQVPLPKQCDEEEVINTIAVEKDVDCFHPFNVGKLTSGSPHFMPCTPYGVLQILQRSGYSTVGKNVVIIGRSNIVGRPLSILLSQKGYDATVTLCHSRTKDLPRLCQQADILIAAIGVPRFVTKDFIKKGAIVIDVGTNRVVDKTRPRGWYLSGDVDYNDISSIATAATPVPGGVGPMTIAMLMYNTINAARYQNKMAGFKL
jgi:methylenetetrahydrofolate dehydrogenase (NADP+)/methenyltetrahydrofolate cyclohydrolase